jgi:hypothetical protein
MDGGKHMQRNDFCFSDLLRVGRGQAGAESWAGLTFVRCTVQYLQRPGNYTRFSGILRAVGTGLPRHSSFSYGDLDGEFAPDEEGALQTVLGISYSTRLCSVGAI